jgi:Asp/Glu/hydantoin racemase
VRIYSVTPIHVDDAELTRRRARYDQLCPQGVTVELHDIGPDAPTALNTAAEVRESEALVAERLRWAAGEGYDALLPDCVLDPAVADLSGELPVPVLGLLRLSVGWSMLTGRRCGAVARNQAIADEIRARVEVYGWAGSFTGVEVLDLDVHAIADTRRWDDALTAAVRVLGESGTTDVVNGCSAVEVTSDRVGPNRVVDPTALALRLVGAGGL